MYQGSFRAWPPRHTLVVPGGSPGGLVGKEAINQKTGDRAAAWDTALPWNILPLVFQLGLHAWLPCQDLGPALPDGFQTQIVWARPAVKR